MGFVLSKFRKKKPSIKDSLEKIDKELRGITRFQVDTELQQKRIIGRLTIFAFIFFIAASIGYYFFGPENQSLLERLLWILPYVFFPIIIWSLRKCLAWWYQRKIVKNKEKSDELRKEREQLLEDVMEKETFKVAKEILEKYAPRHLLPKYLEEQQRASPSPQARPLTSLTSRMAGRMSTGGMMDHGEGLRRRAAQGSPGGGFQQMGPRSMTPGPMQQRFGAPGMPMGPGGPFPNQRMPMRPPMAAIMPPPGAPGADPSTPRFRGPAMSAGPSGMTPMRYMLPLPPANPVLQNRKTGWLDKLVDYVVGDGPASRFALICRYCATHNGLATPEDFPFTSYRCVYCRQFNPSKEQRPSAATLPKNTVLIEEMESTLKSEGEESTVEEDGDGEKPAGDEDKTKEEEGGETGREKGDGESPEPRVELAGSTSDLSSRKSAAGESDNEDRDKLAEAIPFADDAETEEDSVETMGDNVEEVEEESKAEIAGIGIAPVVPSESEVESSEGIGIASS